jgi:hypothetical protein
MYLLTVNTFIFLTKLLHVMLICTDCGMWPGNSNTYQVRQIKTKLQYRLTVFLALTCAVCSVTWKHIVG